MIKKKDLIPPILLKIYRRIKSRNTNNSIKIELDKSEKKALLKRGFTLNYKYDLGLNDIADLKYYLSNKELRNLHINGIYWQIIDNKGFIPMFLKNIPKLNLVYERGELRYATGLNSKFNPNFSDLLTEFDNLVCKPIRGQGGLGFVLLNKNNYEHEINIRLKNKESFIIQNKLTQATYSNNIYPNALNTIRLVIYRDIESKKIIPLIALHKFGTDESAPTDNRGVHTDIDLNTGILGNSYIQYGYKNHGYHSIHPDTKAQIKGVKVANWENNLKGILSEFTDLQWFEFGGLDVIFEESGYTIVELNTVPGAAYQLYKPYLKDQNFVDFLISKGYKLPN